MTCSSLSEACRIRKASHLRHQPGTTTARTAVAICLRQGVIFNLLINRVGWRPSRFNNKIILSAPCRLGKTCKRTQDTWASRAHTVQSPSHGMSNLEETRACNGKSPWFDLSANASTRTTGNGSTATMPRRWTKTGTRISSICHPLPVSCRSMDLRPQAPVWLASPGPVAV